MHHDSPPDKTNGRDAPLPSVAPAQREWLGRPSLDAYPALAAAWRQSQGVLCAIRDTLAAADLDEGLLTVAASGSLGRMEAVAGSDGDLIIIVDDHLPHDSTTAAKIWNDVWAALRPLNMTPPRPDGIYATAATAAQLSEPAARGRIEEDIPTFGKRLQLLWDAQPVWSVDAYQQSLTRVIDWYTTTNDQCFPWWRYLLNDLLRYYRSLCVAYQWDDSRGAAHWRLRNFKLAHSRSVMYAALLCVLGECSAAGNHSRQRLQQLLRLTPLERLTWCATVSGNGGITTILAGYDRFLALLGDEQFRAAGSNSTADEMSDAFRRDLAAFLQVQSAHWSPDFAAALWL